MFAAGSIHQFTLSSIDSKPTPVAEYKGKVVLIVNVAGKFPMMAKASVKGDDLLYEYLTSTMGGEVKWNFTKFLADKDGKVIARLEPAVTPEAPELTAAIERALKQ